MEKIIKLGEKEIPLKATAMNMVIYRSPFGKDFMEVAGSIVKAGASEDYDKIDGLGVARLIWTMAKTYDKDFLPFEKWFEELEAFPIMDVLADTMELIMVNLTSTTTIRSKNATRAVK